MQKVTELQKYFIEIEKKQFNNKKITFYGYISYPSISYSGISVTLTDEGLVKFYFSVYNMILCFWCKWFVPFSLAIVRKWKMWKGETFALTADLLLVVLRHLTYCNSKTFEYSAFSIRQPLMRLKEMEQKIFRKPNCGPRLLIVDLANQWLKVH